MEKNPMTVTQFAQFMQTVDGWEVGLNDDGQITAVRE